MTNHDKKKIRKKPVKESKSRCTVKPRRLFYPLYGIRLYKRVYIEYPSL